MAIKISDQALHITTTLENAKEKMEELQERIEHWIDSMRDTNLENTAKYEKLTNVLDDLENDISDLDTIIHNMTYFEVN